ncbi:MAG: PIN domain-containing protein [Betaproteobacteria bacterium]|nr:PIN domain-containing protein [Betaproteobacteria bacterium]
MGLLIDSDVLILADRQRTRLDFTPWQQYGSAFISAVTASELLVGVLRAQTEAQRARRTAYVEGILAALPALPFDLETARIHARMLADLPKNETVGAHDLLIAATALRHGFPVLTNNGKDFRRLAGVTVLDFLNPQ